MFLAIAQNLQEAQKILKKMMERSNGGFDWSTSHNSPFKPNKLAVMNFPRTSNDTPPGDLNLSKPNGIIMQICVKVTGKYKYLGVILEPTLRWTLHHQKVVARATWWTHQVSRLSKVSGGLSPRCMRQLYNTLTYYYRL